MQQSKPHNRMIVGFDGSMGSIAALRWAAGEAELRRAAVHVVSSYAMPIAVDAGFGTGVAALVDVDELVAATRAQLRIVTERVFSGHPSVGFDFAVVAEQPGPALLSAAERADMLVVGATGGGAVSRFVLGSTLAAVLAASRCPVVVVPLGTHDETGRVVVGVDGSDEGDRALLWAADEADRRRSRFTVLHAWEYPYMLTAEGVGRGRAMTQVDAALVLDRAVGAVRERNAAQVDSDLVRSGAVDALLHASSTADLVAVGSRGRGGFRSMMFGSVAQAVAANAECPVVVVP